MAPENETHMERATGVKETPYHCDVCDRDFGANANITSCPYCGNSDTVRVPPADEDPAE